MNLPHGLDEPARHENERFKTAYEARLREVEKVPLTILVWGPNPQSESPVAKKRNEIREELKDLGYNAMFSEDLSIQAGDISEKAKEFAQALEAHLIFILVESAPGALAEAHDFCNHPDIAPNLVVMIPKKYEEGYSARGAIKILGDAYNGVYWYEDEDLNICNLRKRAVDMAGARRWIRYFFELGARGYEKS